MASTLPGQLIPTHIPSDFRMVSMLDAAYFEDLPPYTPGRSRETDTISILSEAPSYRSEPPAYGDVEPLRYSTYYEERSFFDDSQDDIIMTEVEIEQPREEYMDEEENEPLTPIQSRMDATSQQISSLLYPNEPMLPTRPAPPVPTTPTNESFRSLEAEETDELQELQELPHTPTQDDQDRDFEPRGLPRLSWAPGFRPLDAFSAANYNFTNLPMIARNPNRRQYENVAQRRVREQNSAISSLLSTASPLVDYPPQDLPELTREDSPRHSRETTPTPPSPITTIHTSITERLTERITSPTTPTAPSLRPQEDPELVGEFAARQARQQREYREMLSTDQARALKLESAGWDFMLSQSRDWEERQTSWASFKQTRMRKAERRAARSAVAYGPGRWFWGKIV